MTTYDELSATDELCMRIGRVARAHVNLDGWLRDVHRSLVGPSLGIYLTNNMFSTNALIEDCRMMLSHAEVPKPLLDAGALVLTAAKQVNKRRNDVVHDMWLVVERRDNPTPLLHAGTGTRGHVDAQAYDPPVEMKWFDEVQRDIGRITHRVVALTFALKMTLPALRDLYARTAGLSWDDEIAHWANVMEDRFREAGDGVAYVTWGLSEDEPPR